MKFINSLKDKKLEQTLNNMTTDPHYGKMFSEALQESVECGSNNGIYNVVHGDILPILGYEEPSYRHITRILKNELISSPIIDFEDWSIVSKENIDQIPAERKFLVQCSSTRGEQFWVFCARKINRQHGAVFEIYDSRGTFEHTIESVLNNFDLVMIKSYDSIRR